MFLIIKKMNRDNLDLLYLQQNIAGRLVYEHTSDFGREGEHKLLVSLACETKKEIGIGISTVDVANMHDNGNLKNSQIEI